MTRSRTGFVYQRHSRRCPRDPAGAWLPHRCRGSWSFSIDIGTADDRQRVFRGGYPTKAAAQAALREMVDLTGTDVAVHKLTVGAYLDSWIEGKLALKPSTRSHYSDAIRLYLKPQLGDVLLIDLRAHHLDRMYSGMVRGVRGKPLNPASLRRVHACLRSALNSAVKRRLLNHNPAQHIELPPERPRRPDPWTAEECAAFFEATSSDPLALAYWLLLVTGMRRGEVLGLRWTDCDLRHGNLRVQQQVTSIRGQPVVGEPKTRRGYRVVPIDARTANRLSEHLRQQQAERRAWEGSWEESELVFTRPDGSAIRPDFLTKHFRALLKHHQLRVIRLHDLRHTNATLALEAGVAVKVVSDRLGHSNTAITQDIYMHVAPRVGRDAADRIAGLLDTANTRATDASPPNGDALVTHPIQTGHE